MNDHFKTCPFCATIWPSREAFLKDRDIQLVGYQVNFDELALGLFLFNHDTCKTTLAIQALLLKDLYTGPVFTQRQAGGKSCPGHCLRTSELAACPVECECAWVRDLLQIIRKWPKNDGLPPSHTAN